MAKGARSYQVELQVSTVACPPESALEWRRALALFIGMVNAEAIQYHPLPSQLSRNGCSSSENRLVPKFTANACLTETVQKSIANGQVAMSHNNILCDINGQISGDLGQESGDYLSKSMSHNTDINAQAGQGGYPTSPHNGPTLASVQQNLREISNSIGG